jgi:acyl-CoA synthetase (NDP forming)
VRSSGKPLVVHAMHRGSAEFADANRPDGPLDRLRAGRLPIYASVEDAVAALVRLSRRAGTLERLRDGAGLVSAAIAGGDEAEDAHDELAELATGYFAARQLLEKAGFPFVPARQASDAETARKAASDLGFPVAVKAVGLEHKSDAGGVALGVSSDAELDAVVQDFLERFPGTGLSVESMAPSGVELLVGAVRDRRFGPVVLAGFGGIYTEVLSDTAVALAPVSTAEAEELILSLRASPLLLGARGRPALDVGAAAEALALLSRVAARHRRIAELEVNPLLVAREGVYGLDARMVLEPSEAAVAGDA